MKFKKENKAKTPIYATPGSAGADLSVYKETIIDPNQSVKVDIGLSFEIPENHFGMVVPRSSLFDKLGLVLVNSVGIIDSDYRGNISMNLYNVTDKPTYLTYGTRIGQIIFIPYLKQNFQQAIKLSETTRGSGGYGSTGETILKTNDNHIKYITSPDELPKEVYEFIKSILNTISAFQYTVEINSSDDKFLINSLFNKFTSRIDNCIDNYMASIGYILKEDNQWLK